MATKQINKIAREKEGMVIIMMIVIMDVVLNKKWHLEKTIELVLGTYFLLLWLNTMMVKMVCG